MKESEHAAAIRARIAELEKRRVVLNQEQMRATARKEVNAIERELRAIRMAISHYKAVLELEDTLLR